MHQVPLLCEKLVVSAYCDEKYQDSFDFSNFVDTILFYRGIDRGGGDNVELLRLGNRIDGNSGRYCVPISNLEGGGETYNNLKKTCFHKSRNKIFDQLVKKEVSALRIFISGCYKCILVGFCVDIGDEESQTTHKLPSHNLKVEITVLDEESDFVLTDDKDSDIFKDFERITVNAGSRQSVDMIKLQLDMISKIEDTHSNSNEDALLKDQTYTHLTKLTARFVTQQQSTDVLNERLIIGIQLLQSNSTQLLLEPEQEPETVLYSFRFDEPIISTGISPDTSTCICSKAKIKYTNDGKLNNTVVGLTNCSVNYACPFCCVRTNTFSLPMWLKHHAQKKMSDWDEAKFGKNPLLSEKWDNFQEDACPRTGDNSLSKDWEKFYQGVGPNKEASSSESAKSVLQTQTEVESHSVSKKPLQNHIEHPEELFYTEPLHIFQGAVNHLIKDTCKLLRDAEKSVVGSEYNSADIQLEKSEAIRVQISNQTQAFNKSKKEHGKLVNKMNAEKRKQKNIHEAMKSLEVGSNVWAEHQDKLCQSKRIWEDLQKEKSHFYTNDHGIANRTLKGLKRFEKVVKIRSKCEFFSLYV